MVTKNDRHDEEVEPTLAELLDQLRPTPQRNPQVVKRSQERFLAELGTWSEATNSQSLRPLAERQQYSWWKNLTTTIKEISEMLSPKTRIIFASIAVILIAFVFLTGGTAMTALAAQSALPGDTLYPVKTSLERTRLSLSGDAARRAQLQLGYAERRLGEIEDLIAEGRFKDISTATQEFETHIINALAEFSTISAEDPERAAELMSQITESLTRYGVALRNMISSVPEPVKTEMLHSIQTIQGVSGDDRDDDQINENDDNGNGDDDDNGNLNGNENGNGDDDDNGNLNGNDNDDDDNGNLNGNENGNDDDFNENDNGDDDGNDNGNLNGNENDDNGNEDDDNGNENGNDNDDDDNGNLNGNDNDDDDGGGNQNGNDDDDDGGDDGGGGNQNGDNDDNDDDDGDD